MMQLAEFLMRAAASGVANRRRFITRFSAFLTAVAAFPLTGRVTQAQSDPCAEAMLEACLDPSGTGCNDPLYPCSGEYAQLCWSGEPNALRICHECHYNWCYCDPDCQYITTHFVAVFYSPYCCSCWISSQEWYGAPCDYECNGGCA